MLRTGSPILLRRGLTVAFLTALAAPTLANTAAPQEGDVFYRAYYLEHEVGDLEGALELYASAATNRSLSKEARAEAKKHGQACAEELAARDLARLVPEDTILYVEFNDPGDQLSRLLDQLGLLQGGENAGGIAISPNLLQGTLGLRGAAVAITRIDPTGGVPGGVLILHPGDMQAVRGLIETALPAGGQPVDDIAGHATYSIEGQAFVTMGERLIVASTERGLIEDVMRRVGGDNDDCLAANEELAQTMALRGQDLMFFCFNAEPILPLVNTALAMLAQQEPEAAMAVGMLDVESLRAIAGRLGVDDDGMSMDVSLQLDEDHHNVVFNLLRMPHVGESTFNLIPEGVAFFAASSLNTRHDGGAGVVDAKGRPVVTWMDLGREVFGNVVDVAIFALPSMSEGPGGQPLPDAALAMTVNDVERSKAIWELVLGVAKGASGGDSMHPRGQKFAGMQVDRFDIDGIPVYLFAHDTRVVISPSLHAIEAAIVAAKGRNVAGDPAFAEFVAKTSTDHTSVLGVSVGRLASMAKAVMPPRELREVGPYLELLSEVTLTATTRHSDTQLAWSARLVGLPNIGPLVEKMVRAEMRGGGFARQVAMREQVAAIEEMAHEADMTQASYEKKKPSGSLKALQSALDRLVDADQQDAARQLIPEVSELIGDDANAQNNLAWNIISGENGEQYAKALLPVAQRANELAGGQSWYYLDTLAHVHFALGHVEQAIVTEERAIAVATEQGASRVEEAVAALERFRGSSVSSIDLR